MNRLDASPTLRDSVKTRFRYRCAACGKASALAANAAHLYEDATSRRATADRLIVLCPSCNQAEAYAKAPSKPPLSERFDAEEVSVLARRSYRKGRYCCAYAGYRLAAYLFETRRRYSKAVECLIEATSALRPIRWGDFLASTLLEVERLCLSHEIAVAPRWLCLGCFSLVLYDYRRWQESAELQYASELVGANVTGYQRDTELLKIDRASSFRRDALIKASTGKVGRDGLEKVIGRLLEDAEEFQRNSEFDGYALNLDVAGKLALEVGTNPEEAHKYSQQALEFSAKIEHKWVLQEHHWREADYYMNCDRHRMKDSVVQALRVFADHPVVLEPTLGAAGPVSHNPIAELQKYGIHLDELREQGVAPSRNPPPELALPLQWDRIEPVVNNVMR